MNQRVVITGFGALGATGMDVDSIWQAIIDGDSGIAPINQWDADNWEYKLAAELKQYTPRTMVADKKLLKVITRQDVIGLNASQQAVDHSGVLNYRDSLDDKAKTYFNDRTGVYVGSPGVKFNHNYELLPLFKEANKDLKKFGEKLFDVVHPMWLLRILSNNVLAYVGILNNFKGANHNIPNHGVSSSLAIAEAARAIKNNQMDRAVVVGYETAVEPQAQMYYASMGTLSKSGLRPFNQDHDGTILAEAGAALMIESLESAKERGATIYGEIVADAFSSEAKGIFAVSEQGEGIKQVINTSLEQANLMPENIDFIASHGNANPASDISEAHGIKEVFGEQSVPITAFKWSVGHSIAAAGTLETILALKALNENMIPGIASFTNASSECQHLNIDSNHRQGSINQAMVLSRSFGSFNSALIIKKWV